MNITNQARIAITSSRAALSIALLSYSTETSYWNQSFCENLSNVSTKSKPKYSYLSFDTYMFDPKQSMDHGKIANESCVKHIQIHNMEISVCVAQNKRAYQEDSWIALGCHSPTNIRSRWKQRWFEKTKKSIIPSSMWKNMSLFGVFDGHGGDICSKYATIYFESILEEEMYELEKKKNENTSTIFKRNLSQFIQTLLENTILELDRSFISDQRKVTNVPPNVIHSMNHGGSTAVIVAIHPDSNYIVCSNVGDSRAILIRESEIIPLSYDHSPNIRPDEVHRIEQLGGIVRSNPLESAYALTMGIKACPRVYQQNGIGGLNMTRALGDDYLKPLVIPHPETVCIQKNQETEFIVLASDGIWDVMSNEEVANVIRKNNGNLSPSQFVQSCALTLVQQAQYKGVQDNITCMVIQLPLQKTDSIME